SPSDTFTFSLDRPVIDVRLDEDHFVLCDRIDGGATAARAPAATALRGAFPNPCNPSTTIRFHLAEAGRADLRLYDVRGALVRTLVSGRLGAGAWGVPWDGRNDAGRPLAAGVYFCRLRAGGGEFVTKIVLAR
ncbi:MAG TPA: T9SS type A sorting domain-containing protein, partial [Alphaproteobacteria bacterium]|nr:T9SS type A sorting domain-containing protein [Alphaproteobacteria bacterium]